MENLKSCDEKGLVGCCEERCESGRIEMARENSRALILCGKPKSNDNLKKYKMKNKRRREWRLGFHVVRHSAYIHRM